MFFLFCWIIHQLIGNSTTPRKLVIIIQRNLICFVIACVSGKHKWNRLQRSCSAVIHSNDYFTNSYETINTVFLKKRSYWNNIILHILAGESNPFEKPCGFFFIFSFEVFHFNNSTATLPCLMCFSFKFPFGKRIGIPDKINTKDTPSFESFVKQNQTGRLNLRTDLLMWDMRVERENGITMFSV